MSSRRFVLDGPEIPFEVLQALEDDQLLFLRVLGKHSCKLSNPVVAAEAGEERDGDVDHALGLGDHDRAAAEACQPMALAGVIALEPVRLVLADIEPPLRDRLLVGGPVVGAVETRVPTLRHAGKKLLESGPVTTAAFPVNQSA